MKPWQIVPVDRPRRPEMERPHIPSPPPFEYYTPARPHDDSLYGDAENDSKENTNLPIRGVIIIDM